jgi:hypothetical protein
MQNTEMLFGIWHSAFSIDTYLPYALPCIRATTSSLTLLGAGS